MRLQVRQLLQPLKRPLVAIAQAEASLAARWVASAHRRLMRLQWSLAPQPEHFDHHIDLYYQWGRRGAGWWVERGVFSSLALRPGGRLLELACGDGFNARRFYAGISAEVVACDIDADAIATAQRKNAAGNIRFLTADIRTQMPDGSFDNIVFDAALEHFTPTEIAALMTSIRGRLAPTGVLSGYTIVERADGIKSLSHHEYEFRSKEDLMRFLRPHFARVTVFETIYPERHNLYFWASDGVHPFNADWARMCQDFRLAP